MRSGQPIGVGVAVVVAGVAGSVGLARADPFPERSQCGLGSAGSRIPRRNAGRGRLGARREQRERYRRVLDCTGGEGGQRAAIERSLDFLAEHGQAGASSGPYAARIVSGLVAAGENPTDFGGYDFVARLESYYDPTTGSYGGGNVYGEAIAMLGVLAAERPVPDTALTRLKLNQCRDGGWSWQTGCVGKPDTDTTALALSVLTASLGRDAVEVQRGRQWLIDARRPSGCWGLEVGSSENANSCGLAISAVLALGEDPRRAP